MLVMLLRSLDGVISTIVHAQQPALAHERVDQLARWWKVRPPGAGLDRGITEGSIPSGRW